MAQDAGSLKDGAGVDDGGPAFPGNFARGMTLRDWYAGQAITAASSALIELIKVGGYDGPEEMEQSIAQLACDLADAMIAARNR